MGIALHARAACIDQRAFDTANQKPVDDTGRDPIYRETLLPDPAHPGRDLYPDGRRSYLPDLNHCRDIPR